MHLARYIHEREALMRKLTPALVAIALFFGLTAAAQARTWACGQGLTTQKHVSCSFARQAIDQAHVGGFVGGRPAFRYSGQWWTVQDIGHHGVWTLTIQCPRYGWVRLTTRQPPQI
jgi:hypothetical protein